MKVKVKTGGKITTECCECGLLHIRTYKVIRGRTPQDDIVEVNIFREIGKVSSPQ